MKYLTGLLKFPNSCAVFAAVAAWLLAAPTHSEEKITNIKDWELYGSAKVGASQWNREKWYMTEDILDTAGNRIGSRVVGDSVPVNRMFMDLQYNSFFGARAKSEKLGFRFEVGWVPTVQRVTIGPIPGQGLRPAVEMKRRESLRLRKFYGEWFINKNMTFLVGQDNTLTNFVYSNQIFNNDAGLSYAGALWTGRRPMLKFSVAGGESSPLAWNAKLAVIKPDTAIIKLEDDATFGEEKLPKLEFGGDVDKKFGSLLGVRAGAAAGWVRYDLVNYPDVSPGVDAREKVDCQVVGGNLGFDIWKVSLDLTYTWGKNLSAYGAWFGDPDASRQDLNIDVFFPRYGLKDSGATVRTVNSAFSNMGALIVNVHPLEWLAWEGGAGMVKGRHEDLVTRTIQRQTWMNQMKRWAFYTNFQVFLVDRHFMIVPEFSFSDLGGGSDPNFGGGRWWATGVKFQIDFD